MRGPIDYIVVGFPGNNFKGDVLRELSAAVEQGVIAVLDLALITKDADGEVAKLELSAAGDAVVSALMPSGPQEGLITDEDVAEVADIIANDCSAGLLIVEQLWAKGLKKALIDADGVLLAEGRIHPEAYAELTKEGDK